MTPEPKSEVATHGDRRARPEPRQHNILAIRPPVPVSEGEVVPAVLTIDVGDTFHLAVPMGAFTVVKEKPCFVSTVDLVGLVVASLGIGVGALAVWRTPKLIRAIGECGGTASGALNRDGGTPVPCIGCNFEDRKVGSEGSI